MLKRLQKKLKRDLNIYNQVSKKRNIHAAWKTILPTDEYFIMYLMGAIVYNQYVKISYPTSIGLKNEDLINALQIKLKNTKKTHTEVVDSNDQLYYKEYLCLPNSMNSYSASSNTVVWATPVEDINKKNEPSFNKPKRFSVDKIEYVFFDDSFIDFMNKKFLEIVNKDKKEVRYYGVSSLFSPSSVSVEQVVDNLSTSEQQVIKDELQSQIT